MKFSIYLRRDGRLIEYFRIKHIATGIYFNPTYNSFAARGFKLPVRSLTYHRDGRSWSKSNGKIDMKWLRKPLDQITLPTTVQTLSCALIDSENGRLESDVNPREEDIIVDHQGLLGIEIIISPIVPEFVSKDDRTNSKIFIKNTYPKIIIETFDRKGPYIATARFEGNPVEGVLGKTFFIDDDSRI